MNFLLQLYQIGNVPGLNVTVDTFMIVITVECQMKSGVEDEQKAKTSQ